MNKALLHYYGWLVGVFIFSLAAQVLFPFPFGLVAAIGVVIGLPLFIRFGLSKKLRDAGISTGYEGKSISKHCTVCDKKTKDSQCPRCGSHSFKFK